MVRNEDFEMAQRFHEGTKHPGGRLLNPHHVYTGERPVLFKEYEGGQRVALPADKSAGEMSAVQAIAAGETAATGKTTPDLETVARLLYFSAGITKRINYGPRVGTIPFRAAACTGALYHIELYVVCGDLPGLNAGVYHFDPQEEALTLLRRGDLRGTLVEATGGTSSVARAPLTVVYSDVYWRNAIKYQARAYRHAFWDSGTILSHSLALAAAYRLPAEVVLGFADDRANELLGLDTDEEFALALLPVGEVEGAPQQGTGDLPALEAEPQAKWPRRVGAILEIHRASSLEDGEQAARWRREELAVELPAAQGPLVALPEVSELERASDPLEEVILRRGSSRRFEHKTLSLQGLALALRQSTRGIVSDFGALRGPALNHLYLIASAVQDLAPGAYVYHPGRHALELLHELSEAQARREAGHLALGQDLGADAAVNIYFLSDLHAVLAHYGNRGYRAAQLEASIMAGRIYLAAYAQEIGATGLTFYDDEVVQFFSPQGTPHAQGKGVMFLVTRGGGGT